ncbi:hypothetical protein [Rhodococcus xishaensis]|uniref:Excreted virulence factor EspC, type VII ESX diderm n=1 Tax=Rhodococcus xishaensis TaxID=2487364 RepID=A0A438AWF2_9NOCA|nr:hypothetical protein [Rhodococcus xishaensis]RVW03026.1 hypothetical protein EGT50_09975 [Rhodococcus xishaensis]
MTFDPVSIERAIGECANRIAKGVTVCSNTYSAFLDADRGYDQAYAKAYLEAGGAAHERKYVAELATVEEREGRDLAEAAYRYADRQARALEAELRAWQSVGASVRSMYAVAGRGE